MNPAPFRRILSIYLILALLALSLPAQGWAMLLPSSLDLDRGADRARIQATLETSIVKQRLLDYGLSPEETMARINALSDEQVHQLAANMDSLQPGGFLGDVVFVLLVVLLVIVILQVTGHRIVVRH